MKLIKRDEVLSIIQLEDLLSVIEVAYRAQAEGRTSPPQYINMKVDSNMVHFKAGFIEHSKIFAVKYSGGFWRNEEVGLPVDPGYVIVHDAKTGAPRLMFLDEGAITDYRTAAGAAVVMKYLAKKESRRIGVIGNGIQARLQIAASLIVRPGIERVQVWGRNPQKLMAFLDEMRSNFPQIDFVACTDPSSAVERADILITATASKSPIVQSKWLSLGCLVVAVGACAPDMQEHEPLVLQRADKIYADSIDRCMRDGEIHHALGAGAIIDSDITGELGSLIGGQVPGRENDSEIIFVDLVGLGILDAAVAEHLSEKLLR